MYCNIWGKKNVQIVFVCHLRFSSTEYSYCATLKRRLLKIWHGQTCVVPYWGAADSRPCRGTAGWCLQRRGRSRDRQAPPSDRSSPAGSSLPRSDLGWPQAQVQHADSPFSITERQQQFSSISYFHCAFCRCCCHCDVRQLPNIAICVWSLLDCGVSYCSWREHSPPACSTIWALRRSRHRAWCTPEKLLLLLQHTPELHPPKWGLGTYGNKQPNHL